MLNPGNWRVLLDLQTLQLTAVGHLSCFGLVTCLWCPWACGADIESTSDDPAGMDGGGMHGAGMNGSSQRRPKKEPPVEQSLTCTLEELYKGNVRRMKIRCAAVLLELLLYMDTRLLSAGILQQVCRGAALINAVQLYSDVGG